MIIRVEPSSPVPAYEQIREQVSRLVASGRLRAGAQLPTIRQLAADLGLAKGTVEKAYEVLERDRIVMRSGRRGTVVAERGGLLLDAPATNGALRAAAEAFAVVAHQLGVTEATAIAAVGRALGRDAASSSAVGGDAA